MEDSGVAGAPEATARRGASRSDPVRGGGAQTDARAERRRRLLAEAALVGVAAVWGATFVTVKDAVAVFPVLAFLAWRFLAAAAVVAPAVAGDLRRMGRAGLAAGLAMGAFLTGGFVLQTFGLQRTSASNAGFITGLFVVLTPLFGALVYRERVSPIAWGAAVVSAAGLFLLSGAGGSPSPAGDALVLLCACAFAFHILVTKRAVERHPVGGLVAVQLAACGVVCLAAALVTGTFAAPRTAAVWGALAVTALLASALAFFVQTCAQRRTSAARTALVLATEPAFAGFFAWLWLGERLSPTGWLGAALILGAIVAVEGLPLLARRPRCAGAAP
jgi:drug/metabolite transporter (DMT)-like permease